MVWVGRDLKDHLVPTPLQSCTRINPVLERPPQRNHNSVLSSAWSPTKKPACSTLRYRPAPQDDCTIGPLLCTNTSRVGLWAQGWPGVWEASFAHEVSPVQAYLLGNGCVVL